jgi:hypothetical protein
MKMENGKMKLTEKEYKELFELFSSPTKYERKQIYDKDNEHFYEKIDINKEYELTESKKDYAIDIWRAVIYFLHNKGYKLEKDNKIINLSFIEDEFM